jgi:peroxiredoxin
MFTTTKATEAEGVGFGARFGLYELLGAGAVSAREAAHWSGLPESLVSDWLEAQSAEGYLVRDDVGRFRCFSFIPNCQGEHRPETRTSTDAAKEKAMTTTLTATTDIPTPVTYDVGDVVADFAVSTVGGGEARLSDYAGKTRLLVFTATWCPYCGAEAQALEGIWQQFKDRGVQVIVIDVKEDAATAERFRAHHGWTFPVWLDESGVLGLQFAPLKEGLPPEVAVINAHFILDAEGRVRYRDYLNMEKFDAKAAAVIAELEQVVQS